MIRITVAILAGIVADSVRRRPEEACGLLFGNVGGGTTTLIRSVSTDNVWPDAAERVRRYAIDPLVQMRAEHTAMADGVDLIGMYHSHPHGAAVPSAFDSDRAWPGYIYLIVGFEGDAGPAPRAWALDTAGRFVEHQILSEKSI